MQVEKNITKITNKTREILYKKVVRNIYFVQKNNSDMVAIFRSEEDAADYIDYLNTIESNTYRVKKLETTVFLEECLQELFTKVK